ncbi:hypothetical protein HYH03_017213 [Edaphochlamys debaryana]|uniref:Plastid lipid-associated protein/fibrillin conserved domain-containing protein n=1 Tax=Edaphochlamys debaryana TaxID=47281 RepID=A0A835XJJ1_9CHLO|nr:hypothetical protein HYH03_017213 [Edaphochlamys debaryana]|eukprot:KAG2483968.1 hypothetical protein HYH03_017213 [Edaphochlamys debaryana]
MRSAPTSTAADRRSAAPAAAGPRLSASRRLPAAPLRPPSRAPSGPGRLGGAGRPGSSPSNRDWLEGQGNSDGEDAPPSAGPPASTPAAFPASAPAASSPTPAPASSPAAPSPSPASSSASSPAAPSPKRAARRLERLKVALLAALSSLDRGLAANAREAAEVEELCAQLEGLGGAVALAGAPGAAAAAAVAGGGPHSAPSDLLGGSWRLVYSSAFNTGSLGGRWPGPPAALFPAQLGQVYQRIDPDTRKLDNIVELLLPYPGMGLGGPGRGLGPGEGLASAGAVLAGAAQGLAAAAVGVLPGPLRDALGPLAPHSGPGGPAAAGSGGGWGEGALESPAVRLTLRHDYELTGSAGVRIVYEETFGQLVGAALFERLPRLEAPVVPEPLRPPKNLRSSTFEVVYLDDGMRVTRGDRGELRVYLRDEAGADPGAAAAARMAELDYED